MDPFTQRMLERAKSRREKLDCQKMILDQKSPLQERINVNQKTLSNENDCLECREKTEKQCITSTRKSKLKKLAQFYSSQSENLFRDEDESDGKNSVNFDMERKPQFKLGRLADLANKIKEWDYDLNYSKYVGSGAESNSDISRKENSEKVNANGKQTILDSEMVKKLCSQGFSQSESDSKLFYDFENEKENLKDEEKSTKDSENQNCKKIDTIKEKLFLKTESSTRSQNEVFKRTVFFEGTIKESPNKAVKDPAELPLAERKALFEKNKGDVLVPLNQFVSGQKAIQKLEKPKNEENRGSGVLNLVTKQSETEKKENLVQGEIVPKKETFFEPRAKQLIPDPQSKMVFLGDGQITHNFSGKGEAREKTTAVSPPQSERLYPCLDDLDIDDESPGTCSQSSILNDSKNSNLCLNMTLSELLELNKNNPTTPPSDHSFSQSKECQVLNKMDKLLEDALNDFSSSGTEDDLESMVPSPPKMKKSSSFEYKSGCGNESTLLHTVSFYRKQHQKSHLTIENLDEDNTKVDDECGNENEGILVQNKIQILIAEINKQQTIISQASQALNLCLSTVEFSGSGEQVEGERLLLLATHKRQAFLNEVQRLKVENTLRPQGRTRFLTERGDVNLINISVKLKRDSLRSIAAAENLQYFVCLIKSDEQVLATPAVSTTKENLKDMALQFPGQIKLEGLLSDFKITVEIYNLELSKELLPHDVKYHIVNRKEKKLLTPIKSKKSESKLVKPNIQSPAGPNAVRTSNFQLCGYIVFSLKEISRTQWILNKVPYVSPVEGTISMTIQTQLRLSDEFRGFLTMFDDISGFGAWHRRWCLLSSHFISYWKYPDDEAKKVPIGTIDLRSVITEHVSLVSRDICARLNTFLLETTRPRLSQDKNSLVMSVKDDITTIRHLLSADSKQEMMTWCNKLNTTLALLRSWKCNIIE